MVEWEVNERPDNMKSFQIFSIASQQKRKNCNFYDGEIETWNPIWSKLHNYHKNIHFFILDQKVFHEAWEQNFLFDIEIRSSDLNQNINKLQALWYDL